MHIYSKDHSLIASLIPISSAEAGEITAMNKYPLRVS